MKHFIFAVFILFNIKQRMCDVNTNTFEFGINEGQIAHNTKGTIGLWSKITKVPLDIPQCRKLLYVRVDVTNRVNPPVVSLDADRHVVRIVYRPAQHSVSSYNIITKTVPYKNCGGF